LAGRSPDGDVADSTDCRRLRVAAGRVPMLSSRRSASAWRGSVSVWRSAARVWGATH